MARLPVRGVAHDALGGNVFHRAFQDQNAVLILDLDGIAMQVDAGIPLEGGENAFHEFFAGRFHDSLLILGPPDPVPGSGSSKAPSIGPRAGKCMP